MLNVIYFFLLKFCCFKKIYGVEYILQIIYQIIVNFAEEFLLTRRFSVWCSI